MRQPAVKVIVTKKHKVLLDDDGEPITIQDSNGNSVKLDSDGITLNAGIEDRSGKQRTGERQRQCSGRDVIGEVAKEEPSAELLTTDSVLMCPHGGTVTVTTSNDRVFVNGAAVLLETDEFVIPDCPFPPTGTPHPV